MWKQYTNLIPALVCSVLIGCASGSGGTNDASGSSSDGYSTSSAPPPDVDSSTIAAYNRAVTSMKNGRDEAAISQFAAIAQTHPNLAGAFTNMGLIYLAGGDHEEAAKNLLQATTIKPDDVVAQTHLGVAYRHLGKFQEAKTAYDMALKTNPKYPFAHLNAGILYDIYLSDLARALNHYQQYQALTNGKDKLVDKWIIDLQRRLKKQS